MLLKSIWIQYNKNMIVKLIGTLILTSSIESYPYFDLWDAWETFNHWKELDAKIVAHFCNTLIRDKPIELLREINQDNISFCPQMLLHTHYISYIQSETCESYYPYALVNANIWHSIIKNDNLLLLLIFLILIHPSLTLWYQSTVNTLAPTPKNAI